MTNKDISIILHEMAALCEMNDIPFKPRAYERAALHIEALDRELADIFKEEGLKALDNIPGIGKGIARHVKELLTKGHFTEYTELKKKIPVNISELLAIEGVGPKCIKLFWNHLRIKTLNDLEEAARKGKLRILPRFGKKQEEKVLKGIEFLRGSGGRQILGFLLPEIRALEKLIESFPEVERVHVVGSVMRRKETIGDIDILAVSERPEKVMERFVALPQIQHVYDKGPTKTNVRLKNNMDADIRVVPKESFGAAFNYFVGSKEHNIALRELAIKRGWKLNEYGLFASERRKAMSADLSTVASAKEEALAKAGKGEKEDEKLRKIAGENEEEIYKLLDLQWIEPEMRENMGEIEVARKNRLPKLIGYGDLKGDLQTQTDWTDGENSLEEMADAAASVGLEYITITDHTKLLAMTRGADEKKLLKQMDAIDRLNAKIVKHYPKFRVLKGAEVNISKDGALDIDDKTLAKLDVAGAAVHSHFILSREEQTRRVVRAMENPHIDIIFHLTGRIINRRAPIQIDIDEIIVAAKRTGTVLEINAYPDRLDIKDDYIRKCVEAGVKMAVNSDAHSVQHFKYLEMGIAQARRGWAEKKDIINAWPVEKMLGMLK